MISIRYIDFLSNEIWDTLGTVVGAVMQSFMQCICMYIQTNSITLKLYTIYTSYNKIENCTYLLSEKTSHPGAELWLHRAMASQDSHGPQSLSTWSRPRYQTSAALQPFKPRQYSNQRSLIPHMPVPPQENAPSLSPGQSFGCQSPLPWVAGTDRTGSLRAPWLREFQLPSKVSKQHLPEILFVANNLTFINIISSASTTCSYHESTYKNSFRNSN
jgi:hypothetical protein